MTALQALLTGDAAKYLQSSTTSFAAHLDANSKLYHAHYGSKTLNVGLYMTLFPHTHRCDLRGRTFAEALPDVLRRLNHPYTASSDEFHAQSLLILQRCCHELDTQEAQHRAASASASALEVTVQQQAQDIARLNYKPSSCYRRASVLALQHRPPDGGWLEPDASSLTEFLVPRRRPLMLLTGPKKVGGTTSAATSIPRYRRHLPGWATQH